jgi:hypothetical protein
VGLPELYVVRPHARQVLQRPQLNRRWREGVKNESELLLKAEREVALRPLDVTIRMPDVDLQHAHGGANDGRQ